MGSTARRACVTGLVLAFAWAPLTARATEHAEVAEQGAVAAGTDDLADLSLEDLMNLEITSVSKKAEKLSDSPAAVYVLTQEDLRRSGVTSIPEALRMVPGMQVAQISANRWAISARGFNSEFANKLLVLIDGRSVYTPLFSGVFWDVQDTLMEDIARIEVIRGPGATLWGANAVNGVINIITRTSEETQGGLITAGGGTQERHFGSFRYGGALGSDAHYRVYGKYTDRDSYEARSGGDAGDDWDVGRGGFRLDWDATEEDQLTLQGDFYQGDVGERHLTVASLVPPSAPILQEDADIEGWNSIGRWTHSISESSEATLQIYFDRTKRQIEIANETRDTVDLDFQHRFALGRRQDVVWGAGYRRTMDRTHGSDLVFFDPQDRSDDLFSAFVQDEIDLVEDRVALTLGSKFEYNDYTGFEYQPSGRLLYKPHDDHTVWTAVSRSVRTPSRAGDDVTLRQVLTPLTFTIPGLVDPPYTHVTQIVGNDDLRSERMMAYEAGYRFTPSARFSADLALFYNRYRDLRSNEQGPLDTSVIAAFVPLYFGSGGTIGLATPGAATSLVFDNHFDGHAYGVELASHWDATPWWRIKASYSYINLDLRSQSSLDPVTEALTEGSSPTHQLNLRSFIDLPGGFEFDTMLYYVENLSAQTAGSYVRVDTRLGWQASDSLTLSLVFQNIQESRHEEFGDTTLWPASEVERGIYGKAEWRF